LISFFDYYNNTFDFTRDAGSVRQGTVMNINDCQQFARENQVSEVIDVYGKVKLTQIVVDRMMISIIETFI